MALVTSIQYRYPAMSPRRIADMLHMKYRRVVAICDGRVKMKYPEQIALESLLTDETVAKLKQLYYAPPALTFWDRYITEGGTHARRK